MLMQVRTADVNGELRDRLRPTFESPIPRSPCRSAPSHSSSTRRNPREVTGLGKACNLELIIADIRDELRGRPYEIAPSPGAGSFRTKLGLGVSIRAALGLRKKKTELSASPMLSS